MWEKNKRYSSRNTDTLLDGMGLGLRSLVEFEVDAVIAPIREQLVATMQGIQRMYDQSIEEDVGKSLRPYMRGRIAGIKETIASLQYKGGE